MIRRKNYLIKKKFQFNFLSRFVALIVIESILIAALFMYVASNTITTGYFGSTLTVERTTSFFFVSMLLIVLIVAVGIGLAGLVLFVLLSHRIAGPLYRFEKIIKQIELGDLTTRMDLRRTDQLTELKEALNTMAGALDGRLSNIKKGLSEIERLLSAGDPQAVAKISQIAKRLKDEIGHFKVTATLKE
jgi:methyl-accepting chemotaxis protein